MLKNVLNAFRMRDSCQIFIVFESVSLKHSLEEDPGAVLALELIHEMHVKGRNYLSCLKHPLPPQLDVAFAAPPASFDVLWSLSR